MGQEERLLNSAGRGNIKPTVELREALEEIEKCKSFFEKGGFIDYLHSVNQCYLENQGKVVSPEPIITDNIESDNADLSEVVELSDSVTAGIIAYLEWQTAAGTKITKGLISITLRYKGDNYNLFDLVLYASLGEKLSEESLILDSRYKRKVFYLKPNQRMQQDVDNLLLTFTGELLGAQIL